LKLQFISSLNIGKKSLPRAVVVERRSNRKSLDLGIGANDVTVHTQYAPYEPGGIIPRTFIADGLILNVKGQHSNG
jgi:hypothetical protein